LSAGAVTKDLSTDGNNFTNVTGNAAGGNKLNFTNPTVGQLIYVKGNNAAAIGVTITGGAVITCTQNKTTVILVTATNAGVKLGEF